MKSGLLVAVLALCVLTGHAAQYIINLGTSPNDASGDDLRTGGGKINTNFTYLFDNRQPSTASLSNWSGMNPADTNATLVLCGKIQRDSSGNPRGDRATDLQFERDGSPTAIAAAPYSFIGGGRANAVQANALYSAVVCGLQNAGPGAGASAILCGTHNLGPDAGMTNSWIGGGNNNDIIDGFGVGTPGKGNSWIGGGNQNQLDVGLNGFIGAGSGNLVGDGLSSYLTTNSMIGSGSANTLLASHSAILAGTGNTINNGADYSHIIGNNLTVSAAKRTALGDGAGTYAFLDTNFFVRAGQSASNAVIGGSTFFSGASFTNLNPLGTLSNMASCTIPAHTLTNTGDRFFAEWHGRSANIAANSNRIVAKWGSSTLIDTGLQTNNAPTIPFYCWVKVRRTGPTGQHVDGHFEWGPNGTVPWAFTNVNFEITETNGIDTLLALQGASSAPGGITNNSFEVELRPASR